jgi:uncharacterized protein
MNRPVHFEIPAGDGPRIREFYTKVFGWQFRKYEGPGEYWLIHTGEGPGIDGGLMPRREPGGLTVNTMDVESVDDAVKKVLDGGGTLAVAKIAIPGIGWLAYCKDPEGTLFGLMQNDPSAQR